MIFKHNKTEKYNLPVIQTKVFHEMPLRTIDEDINVFLNAHFLTKLDIIDIKYQTVINNDKTTDSALLIYQPYRQGSGKVIKYE